MENTTVDSICIVGGGTAGWLTAAFLLKNLPTAKITLVESPNIPTVGVGEATILNFDKFLKFCGFEAPEWMAATDAIYKSGIVYPDWRGNGVDVWHPFAQTARFKNHFITMADVFYNTNLDPDLYYQLVLSNYDTCVVHNKVPMESQMAYHLDAVKLANFITASISKEIRYFKEDVVDVESDGHNISKLTITNFGDVTADLYIDCTGFKRLLSGKIEGAKWIDKSYMLPNNAAIATPISYVDQPKEMRPYTTAQPMEHGWMWKTPIQTRIGSGLVYNRDILSDDEAIKIFTDHWGEDRLILQGKFNKIKWDPEYNVKNWRGNCVSIGLASGFLEPLESTGLALITAPVVILHQMISKGWYGDLERNIFNNEMESLYNDATDFVGMHYMNNLRPGKYWDMVRERWRPSETLELKIQQHRRDLIRKWATTEYAIIGDHSWNVWFHAVGVYGRPRPLDPTELNCKETLIGNYVKNSKYEYTKWASNYEIMMRNRELTVKPDFPYNITTGSIE